MQTGEIIRVMLIVMGIVLFINMIFSLAKKRMKEQFCLVWGFISILLFISGILLHPDGLSQYISASGTVIIVMLSICVVWALFYLSIQISVLSRKNQELAMQVSLLNQENEWIMRELKETKEKVDAK